METQFLAESWRLTLVFAGGNTMADGLVHRKYAPCLIVAQALRGSYEVTSPRGHCIAREGECFLARAGEDLTIVHHGSRGGRMKARWVHLDFRVGAGVDPFTLVDLPTKAVGATAHRLGRHIALMLQHNQTQQMSLIHSAANVQNAFSILTTLLAISPLMPAVNNFQTGIAGLQSALRLMHERLAEPITPDELAAASCLSVSHFYALFRQVLKCSPMTHLKRLRLQRARQLLTAGSMPLKQVAEQTGFQNVYHFSREFHHETGLPPGEFRARHGW